MAETRAPGDELIPPDAAVLFRTAWYHAIQTKGAEMVAQPEIQTMKISEVKQGLNRLVNQVYRHEARIVVEKSGIPVAGIVSVQDLERLARLDREREEGFTALDEFAAGFADQTPEEIERETERALAEVRAERRQQAVTAE
jgi:prevent-host-death family protein